MPVASGDEIVIDSGLSNNGVSLVRDAVGQDAVIVAVIPKAARKRLGNGGRV